MKQTNYLKGLRVLLAILFFVPILALFIDFAGLLPQNLAKILHIQLVPAILGGMVGVIVFQFVLALLFGRIYCSTICPAGVLQDVFNRLFCIRKKKKDGTHRFSYHKPMNLVRYPLLAVVALLAVFGVTELLVWLDPYSNFGRIAANLFRPTVMWGNNVIADLLMKMDNYSLFHVTINTVTAAGLISGIVALVVFAVMSIRGRLFCNTLCPVGGMLSLVSRYSFFRFSFDKSTCNNCGSCERTCKTEAINSKDMTVDMSRCVDCFNCISSCNKSSIQYRFKPFYKKESQEVTTTAEAQANSRRTFLATGATVAASLPVVAAVAQGMKHGKGGGAGCKSSKNSPITPPGSLNLERFKDKCTACHICVVKCPSQVLRPAGMEYGFDYMLRPEVSYENSYCNYECTVCSDVCPNGAIKPITVDEKVTTQVGIANFYINRCIVNTDETDCGACSEHCPTQAVHMIPYKGTLTIPKVEPELCIGCGGCESICPVRPRRAIIIKANEVHQPVQKPKEEKVEDVKVDDFGF